MKIINQGDILQGLHPKLDILDEGIVESENRTVDVLGVSVQINELYLVSKKDGELLANHQITKQNIHSSFDAYKKKVGLLTSKEIIQIRKKRGWSQEKMAQFLDIGLKDIARYENGSIQTRSIDNMIRLIDNDHIFIEMARYLNKLSFAE